MYEGPHHSHIPRLRLIDAPRVARQSCMPPCTCTCSLPPEPERRRAGACSTVWRWRWRGGGGGGGRALGCRGVQPLLKLGDSSEARSTSSLPPARIKPSSRKSHCKHQQPATNNIQQTYANTKTNAEKKAASTRSTLPQTASSGQSTPPTNTDPAE